MPETPLFPNLDFEFDQIRGLQDPGPLPDYGIPGTVSRIQDIYDNISRYRLSSPLVSKGKGGMKSPEDFMFPSIREALVPKTLSSDAGPTPFDPQEERLGRYEGSKYEAELGFLPGRDNEELYGRRQSGWEAITNGLAQAWQLGKFQFVDQLKGWGRLVDGIFSGDLSSLYDQGDAAEVSENLDRIMDNNPVFLTEKDRNSIFTAANFANIIGQTGFTLGAIAEIAAEEIFLTALTAGSGGAAAPVQAARTAQLTSTIGRALRRMNVIEDAVMDADRMRKVYGRIANYVPFTHTIQTIARGARAEENTASLLSRGFGAFYRDVREANAAFTEARAETSGTYARLKDELTDQLYASSQPVTQDKLDEVERVAREATDANFWANAAIIGVSNRIQFDNIFRGFKGASRYLNDVGKISEDAAGYFQRSTIPFTKGFIRTAKADMLPNFFRYFKNNITEALQENFQSASDQAISSYYKAYYDNPGTASLRQSINDSISAQFTTEGAKTFLSGFLVGALTSPLTKGVPAIYNRINTSKEQRNIRKQNIQNQLNTLNGFFSKPDGRNGAVQFSIAGAMGEAIQNKDIKGFVDLKDESVRQFARSAIETGKADSLFARLESIAKGLTKEEFQKAFGIEYSEDNKKTAMDYIQALRKRTEQVKEIKENLDFKFQNPFLPSPKNTPEDNAKLAAARTMFEEAKWHVAYLHDAHRRTNERQKGILNKVREDMKEMSYSAVYSLLDPTKVQNEIKMLKQEASLITDERIKAKKLQKATLLSALLPGLKKGELDAKTFTEYANFVQEMDERAPIEQSAIEDSRTALQDYYALAEDQRKYMDNINFIADPKNFADFMRRHQAFEASESFLANLRKTVDDKLNPVREAHPNLDITMDEEGGVTIKSKEGETVTDEEMDEAKKKTEEAFKEVLNPEKPAGQEKTVAARLAEMYDKLTQGGQLDDQDKDFLNRDDIDKNDPNYIKIQALLAKDPPKEETPEEKKDEEKKDEEPKNDPDDPNGFPYYDGSEEVPPTRFGEGDGKTIIQEVVKGDAGGTFTPQGDVKLEGGYSYFRGQIARLLLDFPALREGVEFVLIRDSPAFYDHLRMVPKEVQEKLGALRQNSPYNYFAAGKKPGYPVILLRDRTTKNFIYFNPDVAGMVTTENNGLICALNLDFKKIGVKREQVMEFLDNQPNKEFIVPLEGGSTEPISKGAYFEGKELRDVVQFMEGVEEGHGATIYVSQGLKDFAWNEAENLRNGGAFLSTGESNKIKLLPSKLDSILVDGKVYDLKPWFDHSFDNPLEAERAKVELTKIIYSGVFTPQNQLAEKIIISTYPDPKDTSKTKLKLIRLVDTTPNERDSRKKEFKDSRQGTFTILEYLFKAGRRMNVLKDMNQDISLPFLENGKVVFKPMNYQDMMVRNLFTKKARVVLPDGRIHISAVNNFFVFPGLADRILFDKEERARAEMVIKKLTETKDDKPAPPAKPEASNPTQPWNDFLPWEMDEQKIADIEKRREDELSRVFKRPDVGFAKGAEQDKLIKKAEEEINAKYDAELAALKKQQDPKEEPKDPPSASDLAKKFKNDENPPSPKNEDFNDDILPKLKDGIQRALMSDKELQFIKDRFGEHVVNVMSYAANSEYWGYWKSGLITLFSDTPEGVGYHEAWHHFSQMFLTIPEKIDLYTETIKLHPELAGDFKKVEEFLADSFSEFALNKDKIKQEAPKRFNIFEKIWKFFLALFGPKATKADPTVIDQYFQKLYQGNLHSYTPSINNAMWNRLNAGFYVTRNNKRELLFNVQEEIAMKGFFRVMLNRAFSSDDASHNLKRQNISMASIMGLRNNPSIRDKALQSVYFAVRYQMGQYIEDNMASLSNVPATLSLLERLNSHFHEFFGEMMRSLQIPSNVEDIIEQETTEEEEPVQSKSDDQEGVETSDTMERVEEELVEAQFGDRILPFMDKGLLATISRVLTNFVITIPKAQVVYDETGNIVRISEYRNSYGLPEPCDVHRVLTILGEEFAGIFNDHEMLNKLNSQELLERLPEVHFIRQALPGFGVEGSGFSVQTIINLMRDFNRVFVPIHSIVQLDDFGQEKYTLVEKTRNTESKIKRLWQDNFLSGEFLEIDPVTTIPRLVRNFMEENWDLVSKKDSAERMIANRVEALSNLGITFSERTQNSREFRELMRGNRPYYFFTSLRDRLERGQIIDDPIRSMSSNYTYEEEGSEQKVHISSETTFIDAIVKLEARYSDVSPSNVFVTATGRKKYSLMVPSLFNVVGDALRKARTIQDLANEPHLFYLVDPMNYFMQGSLVMKSLFNAQGVKIGSFEIGDYNGIEFKVGDKRIKKDMADVTGREKLIANINSMYENGAIDLMRTGSSGSFYFYRIREWHHRYEMKKGEVVQIPAVKNIPFSNELYEKGKPNSNFKKALRGYFFNLLVDEVSVMKFAELPRSSNFQARIRKWGVFDKILSDDLKSRIEKLPINSVEDVRDALYPLVDKVVEDVEWYFWHPDNKDSRLNSFLKYASRLGVTSDSSGRPGPLINDSIQTKYKTSWRELAANFLLNTFVMNVEYARLYASVPQFYKDYHKRASGPVSPGNNANSGNIVKGQLRSSHVRTMAAALGKPFREDIHIVQTNVVQDDFTSLDKETAGTWEAAGKSLGVQKEIKVVIDEYNQIKHKGKPTDDGQAWCTFDFYRRFRIQLGNWNFDTDEIEYQKEVVKWRLRKNLYDSEDQKKVLIAFLKKYPRTLSTFPVIKLQYNGPQKARGVMLPVYHKFAVAPLIPSVYEGMELEKMQDWMLERDRDYMIVESGSKNYMPDPMQFWTDPKNRDTFNVSMDSPADPLFSIYLKEQVKTSGATKSNTTWGTQIRSLWASNRFSNGEASAEVQALFRRYQQSLEGLIEIEKEQLFREFGIVEDDGTFTIRNAQSFVKALLAQVEIRNLNSNVKRSIGYDEVRGTFETPLEIVTNRQSVVDMISGMIFRKMVRLKVNGDMLVQIPATGTLKPGEKELRFYMPLFDKNGKFIRTQAAECKLAFGAEFTPLLNLMHPDKKKINSRRRLNEAIADPKWRKEHSRQITIVAYRFPTEGPHSMEFMEIREFLPETFGPTIIMPNGTVIKVGSDFDHDKVNIFRPNYDEGGRMLTELTKESYGEALDKIMRLAAKDDFLNSFVQRIFEDADFEDKISEETIEVEEFNPEQKKALKQFMHAKKQLKGYLTNVAVDAYIQSLSSPEMFMQLIRPNNTDNVRKVAIEMAKKAGLEGFSGDKVRAIVNTEIFDYTNNHIKFSQNVQGRNDLAVWAILNKMLHNFQVSGFAINKQFRHTFSDFKKGRVSNNITIIPKLLAPGERGFITDTIPLGSSTDVQGRPISEMISELMGATVDIEKDAFYIGLGINRHNKGVAAVLLLMRVPLERISAFLRQPVMERFYYMQDVRPFFVPEEGGTAYFATNINARQIMDPNGKTLKNRDQLESVVARLSKEDEHFPLAELVKQVGNTQWNTVEQKRIFAHFLALQRFQRVYMKIQNLVTTDTKKISSPVASENFNIIAEELLAVKIINEENLEKLTSKTYTAPFRMRDMVQQVFATIMPVGFSPAFVQNVARQLKAQDLFLTKDEVLKLERSLANDFMTYIILEFGQYNNMKLKDFVKNQIVFDKKTNSVTLVKRFLAMSKQHPELMSFYSLTSKLRTNISRRKATLQNMELLRGMDNSTEMQDVLIDDFEKLISFRGNEIPGVQFSGEDVQKIRTFFRDLAVTALGQSGFNKSLLYMTDVLPLSEINPITRRALAEYKKKNLEDPTFESSFINRFIHQFMRENPQFGFGVKTVNKEPWRGKYLNAKVEIVKEKIKQRFFRVTDVITREEVQASQETLFLFGDNLRRKGLRGQAKEMRGEENAVGIVTKRSPSNDINAFFKDDKLEENKKHITADIEKAIAIWKAGIYEEMVVPPLGEGLAKLKEKAPKTWAFLQEELKRLELIVNGGVVDAKPASTPATPVAPTKVRRVALTDFVNHSGGANGSDSVWDDIGKEFGMVTNRHYYHKEKTPRGNTPITEADAVEGQQKVTIAARQMGRIEPTHQVRDTKLIRNWSQVKYSDAVFAVTTMHKVGDEMKYGKKAKIAQGAGGTGYAIQMAINEGKPVFVFDQERKIWYTRENNKWVVMDTVPTLTKNFAGIGTRQLNADGKAAIRAVYEKTAEQGPAELPTQTPAPAPPVQSAPPAPAEPLKPEPGRYVKYQGEIFIITKMNSNGTVQIYDPTEEGTAAKKSVAERNLTLMDRKGSIVIYKDKEYIVTAKGTIISLTTNKRMNWGPENGDRKAILELAAPKEVKTEAPKVVAPKAEPIVVRSASEPVISDDTESAYWKEFLEKNFYYSYDMDPNKNYTEAERDAIYNNNKVIRVTAENYDSIKALDDKYREMFLVKTNKGYVISEDPIEGFEEWFAEKKSEELDKYYDDLYIDTVQLIAALYPKLADSYDPDYPTIEGLKRFYLEGAYLITRHDGKYDYDEESIQNFIEFIEKKGLRKQFEFNPNQLSLFDDQIDDVINDKDQGC